jgi:hypothetical protein
MANDLVETDELDNEDFDLGFNMDDIMPIFMMIMAMSMIGMMQSQQASQALSAQSFTGFVDEKTLYATPAVRYINLLNTPPYTPWISATFYNISPDTAAYISINSPDNWVTIYPMSWQPIDMSGGTRRIEFIYYKTDPPGTATIRAVGKY